MRAAKSRSLVEFMESQVFLQKGVPEKIISDNGKQFVSKLFKDLLTQYEIDHLLNPAYHPQVNPAERVNKVVVSALKSYVGDDQTRWDCSVPKIAAAINTSVHVSTGYTPFFIEHGRKMSLTGKEHKVLCHLRQIDPVMAEENRLKRFGELHESVKHNLAKAYNGYAKHYNLRTRPSTMP
jgi:transposase InsO family protein